MVQPVQARDAPQPAAQAPLSALAGEYVHSEMELVAGILLRSDGTFEYGLTVGSLDQRASGRWKSAGTSIELTSDPRPVAPTITPGPIAASPGAPFAIRILAPGGSDVPGVDFKIDFDSGEPLESYSPGGPWSLPDGETRVPRFVTFAMPAYRLQSDRLPLDAKPGTTASFALTPNDFGVADLTGVAGEIDGDTLVLRRPEGVMEFRRRKAEPTDPS
jgi:hypothetical protein